MEVKKIKLIFCLMMALFFFLSIYISESFAISNAQTQKIKVGFPLYTGFSEVNEKGEISGYLYDYLQEISKYTGWEYEYVIAEGRSNENLNNILSKLQNGEIDIMGGIIYLKSAADRFDYPEYSSGMTYATLSVLPDNRRFSDANFQAFNNIKVGVQKTGGGAGGRNATYLNNFCSANGIKVDLVYFDTFKEVREALHQREVDAILSNDFMATKEERIVARFGEMPYYFVTTKGNTNMVNSLNYALAKIQETSPNLSAQLYKKHFDTQENYHFFLTEDEQAFIKNIGKLRVAAVADLGPLQGKDEPSGKYKGIANDLLQVIGERSGLQFQFIPVKTYKEALELASSGAIDLLICPFNDNAIAQEHNIVLSTPIMPLQTVIVKNKNIDNADIEGQVLAVREGYPLQIEHPEELTVKYKTLEECIEAVNRGDAAFCFGNSMIVEYYSRNQAYENIALVSQSTSDEELTFGLVRPVPIELLTIVNKSLRSLEKDELQSIINQNTIFSGRAATIPALIRSNPSFFLALMTGITVLIITAISVIAANRVRSNRREALANKRYRLLSEMSNEYVYEYDYREDLFIVSDKFSQMFGGTSQVKRFTQTAWASVSADTESLLYQNLCAAIKAAESVMEFETVLTNGQKIWVRSFSSVIYDENEQPLRRIGKLIDINHEKHEKESLLNKAQKDFLTGLFNKGATEKLIEDYLENCPEGEPSVLIILDVDNFKFVNDNLGHIYGDTVLKTIAERLRRTCREHDIVGRVGGDEFVILLKNMGRVDAEKIAERLCAVIRSTTLGESTEHILSISVGMTLAAKGCDYLALLHQADASLYRAKHLGKNGYHFYDESDDDILEQPSFLVKERDFPS